MLNEVNDYGLEFCEDPMCVAYMPAGARPAPAADSQEVHKARAHKAVAAAAATVGSLAFV